LEKDDSATMTRAKLIQIARFTLRAHAGDPLEQVATALADGIELFLKMEAEIGEETPERLPDPIGDVFDTKAADFKTSRLPASPAIQKAPPEAPREPQRLVVMPDSPEAREALLAPRPDPGAPPPLRPPETPAKLTVLPSTEPLAQAPGEKIYWRVEKISEILHAQTPPKIKIVVEHPERGEIPIMLERNVVIGAGFDSVKLSYKPVWATDDMSVQATFSTTQKELPIGEEVEKLQANAIKLYSPRPRTLRSTTPPNYDQSSYGALLRIGIDAGTV